MVRNFKDATLVADCYSYTPQYFGMLYLLLQNALGHKWVTQRSLIVAAELSIKKGLAKNEAFLIL